MIYDKDIREPLFDWLELTFGKVRVIEEKTIGKSRADVFMVLPDCICGIEIKSDADTYTRLARQVKDYDRYFDRNLVVVGTSHAMHIEEHVPAYWGIVTVEDTPEGLDFYLLRKPGENEKAGWDRKMTLLWRPELAAVLEAFEMPKYKAMSKPFVIGKILAAIGTKIPEDKLKTVFSNLLFERDYDILLKNIEQYREEHKRPERPRRKRRRRRKSAAK